LALRWLAGTAYVAPCSRATALVVAILVPFRNAIIPAMATAIQDMFAQAG
jgi:hypothetical protein